MIKQEEAYILSYIKGTLTEEDRKSMDNLYHASPDFRKMVDDIAFIHGLLENVAQQQKINTRADWDKLKKRIVEHKAKRISLRWMRNAAAVLLVLFLSWQLVTRLLPEKAESDYTRVTSSAMGVSKIVLPDGSEVWLNASSTLIYPKKFVPGSRTVQLEGEAYFKVVSDKQNRFNVVMANGMYVSAYGTEFNISAYPHEQRYSVLLTHGHLDVFIPETKETRSISAGEEVVVKSQSRQPEIDIKKAEDVQTPTAWKEGKLVFYKQTLGDIAGRLSKRFNVAVEFADSSIISQEYTATFDTENITEILDLLKQAGRLNYEVINQNTKNYDEKKTKIIIQKAE